MKLKPCPFCGNKEPRMTFEDNGCGGHVAQVVCKCTAMGPWVDHSKERAEEFWNQRTRAASAGRE